MQMLNAITYLTKVQDRRTTKASNEQLFFLPVCLWYNQLISVVWKGGKWWGSLQLWQSRYEMTFYC